MIAYFDEPLPRYPVALTVGALAGGSLKPRGRVAHRLALGFHAGAPMKGTHGCNLITRFKARGRPILINLPSALRATIGASLAAGASRRPLTRLLYHLEEHFSGLGRIPYFSQEGNAGSAYAMLSFQPQVKAEAID